MIADGPDRADAQGAAAPLYRGDRRLHGHVGEEAFGDDVGAQTGLHELDPRLEPSARVFCAVVRGEVAGDLHAHGSALVASRVHREVVRLVDPEREAARGEGERVDDEVEARGARRDGVRGRGDRRRERAQARRGKREEHVLRVEHVAALERDGAARVDRGHARVAERGARGHGGFFRGPDERAPTPVDVEDARAEHPRELSGCDLSSIDELRFGGQVIHVGGSLGDGSWKLINDRLIEICPPQCLPPGQYSIKLYTNGVRRATRYVDLVEPTRALDGTRSGNFDVADEAAPIQLPGASTLFCQWTGADPGAIAHLNVQATIMKRSTV